ncbi:thiamine phosphate synthase [Asticcacaulis tiandongensis]|uniref:thiamine phosphate synthase n=1 Tax=Asticcacaulis tiandongensis TaxID=2565365 RepID=UPI001FE409F5|nr:thiamine phosphate synthase [Asticcacaulis tiandongensis]
MTYKTRFAFLMNRAKDIARHAHMSSPRADLPCLYFFTDPVRTPHPEDIAAHLPEGSAIVYRHFGDRHAPAHARVLHGLAKEKNLYLLIGNDAELALEVGAAGMHLSESHLKDAVNLRTLYPALCLTGACHKAEALKQTEITALDAIFVSPVFPSHSLSAVGKPALGLKGIEEVCALSPVPVMGLGGITADNAHLLSQSGLSGFGAIDAFKP